MEKEKAMLFFCEECGGKNIVPDVASEQKIIRFRCRHCQYETVVEKKSTARGVESAEVEDGKMHKAGTGPR